MILTKKFPQLTLAMALAASFGYYQEAWAAQVLATARTTGQTVAPSVAPADHLWVALNIVLPPAGAPGRRQGAAGRNFCPQLPDRNKPLTALVPDPDQHLAQTISEHPTFWFYIPYRSEQVYIGKFMLKDQNDEIIYEGEVALPEEPGIIGLELPETIALSESQEYYWHFRIQCSEEKSSAFDYVEGPIKRVKLEIPGETAPLRERLNFYAANGLWYELITELAKNPGAEWVKVLDFVGLGAIAREPIHFRRTLEP